VSCADVVQVDVRALKDVIWDKLNTVAEVAQQQEAAAEEEEMEGSMIHFQQVSICMGENSMWHKGLLVGREERNTAAGACQLL
jgi:hypothetical protein